MADLARMRTLIAHAMKIRSEFGDGSQARPTAARLSAIVNGGKRRGRRPIVHNASSGS